jgi:RNA polymerase sigma factor (sigma-70 family)
MPGGESQAPGRLRRWSLVWSQRPRLLRMARRRTASEQDAEDVVAEALLRAMEAPDIDEERLPAWLTTVTIRLCIDVQRERAREQRLWSRSGLPAAAASCEERVCDVSEAAWISRRLTALPARQAQALRLRADGHDVAGVARSLGVSYSTAESLLARGRAAARAWLVSSLAALAALAARWAKWRTIRIPTAGKTVAVSAGLAAVGVAVATHAGLPHAGRPPAAVRPDARHPAAPPATLDANAGARHHPASRPVPSARSSATPTAGPSASSTASSTLPVSTPAIPAAGIPQPAQSAPGLPPVLTAPPRLPALPSLHGGQLLSGLRAGNSSTGSIP